MLGARGLHGCKRASVFARDGYLHQSPYRYNVYPAQAINAAALQAISGLGFSFQQNSKPPPFPECDAASEKHKDGFERFWTDYLTLDEVQLAKMGLSWAQLGIAPTNP